MCSFKFNCYRDSFFYFNLKHPQQMLSTRFFVICCNDHGNSATRRQYTVQSSHPHRKHKLFLRRGTNQASIRSQRGCWSLLWQSLYELSRFVSPCHSCLRDRNKYILSYGKIIMNSFKCISLNDFLFFCKKRSEKSETYHCHHVCWIDKATHNQDDGHFLLLF